MSGARDAGVALSATRRRKPGLFLRVAGALFITTFLLWAASAASVITWGAFDQARKVDAIVVLGAAQYDGRPSPVLKARLDHALDLWTAGLGRKLVVTGGRGTGDTTSEAAVSRAYAGKRGVPDSMILLETTGRTTRESMESVAAIMKTQGYRTVILVSDPFHMLRLWIIAKRLGMTPYTSPTRTSPISPNREKRWRYILSESIKVPVAFIFERTM